MKKKIFFIVSTLVIMLLFSSSTFALVKPNSKRNDITITKVEEFNLEDKQAITGGYKEFCYGWIGTDGWVNSYVGFEGIGLVVGDLDFSTIPQMYLENLDWVSLSTHYSGNPFDLNTNLDIDFRGLSFEDAQNAANLVKEIIQQFLIVELEFEGSYSHDEWRGEWVEILSFRYSGHADWSNIKELYEGSIPTEKGGIAATIDISEANELRFEGWYNSYEQEIVGRIGFSFGFQKTTLVGGHSISLKEIFHIDNFEASSEATDPLNIYVELPDVENVALSPWYNDTQLMMYLQYHPNIEEPWNKDSTYSIIINLSSGKYISDFIISFDYIFVPWDLRIHEEAGYFIDPRGYDNRYIGYQGDYASLSIDTFDKSILENVFNIDLWYYVNAYSVAEYANIVIDLRYTGPGPHNNDTIINYFESILGYTFTFDEVLTEYSWDDFQQQDVEITRYTSHIDNFPKTDFNNILANSIAYKHSSMINSSNILPDITRFHWKIDYLSAFDDYRQEISFLDYALDEYDESPTKAYTETSVPNTYTIDLLNKFGWTTFPYSSESNEMKIEFISPVTNLDTIVFDPDKGNGWGYDSWFWTDWRNNYQYIYYNFNWFTETPYTTDDDGNKVDPVTALSITFENQFEPDTVDIEPPNINGLLYYPHPDEWDWDIWSYSYSGVSLFGVDVDDNGWLYYYDTSVGYMVPRFPGSGIANVDGKLYYNALPTEFSGVTQNVSFTWNSTADLYTSYIDFSSGNFADGEWGFEVHSNDSYGNDAWMYETINVDNYDDEEYVNPASVVWTSTTPEDGATVSGEITIEAEISDDVGVFLVVIWANFGGWLFEDPDEDGVYSKTIDTTYYVDGPLEIIIEVWDMEGHHTVVSRTFTIDNVPSGDPPSITFIYPTDGETVTGTIVIQAEVLDDIGLRSVTFSVDDRTPMAMYYNDETGYYEVSYNTNQLSNGMHIFYVTAVDQDENVHTVTVSVEVEVTGSTGTGEGNPPEYNLINVPVNQTEEELATQITAAVDESKAVVDVFTWEIEAKDDYGLNQISISIDDNLTAMEGADAGPDTWSTWIYEWDSTQVKDGAHYAVITISDIDTNQHTIKIVIGFTTNNGNVGEKKTFGIDGYTYFWAILAIIPISIIKTVKRRRKQ
ncbi:MAG: Ig-like domain-containing protein [Candidatus Heimdallarchaeaceae archaeon]